MELTLSRTGDHLVLVTCDGHDSHTFDLLSLRADLNKQPPLLVDPISSGKLLFHALFAPETPACAALMASPSRILLVPGDDLLDALPWEYAYGPDGFLVCDVPFVRGLPQQRHRPPVLDQPLHIVAIPSHPLEKDLPPLDIDGEWMRLRKTIQELPYQMTLERTRPPTIERVRNLVANQHHRVIHFMGHGGQDEKAGAFLCFEAENGKLAAVTAKQFALRVRGTAFLVTLNACVSASPGETRFSNLASALVQQHVPYALGMRFSIHDDDARLFSRTFYSELARGVPVEEALLQARLSLSESERAWVVGVPVLYTSLDAAAPGFTCIAGTPTIDEHQPPMDVIRLPRAEGTFQGRIDEIQQLGTLLTSDSPPRLLTIHGAGGQGKTALAREAVERFAHAWPGGVFATTLETLPEPDVFLTDMARFLAIDPNTKNLERDVLHRLEEQRTLIVLDNAETLVESVNANNEPATNLAQFLRERIVSTQSCFLVTSRDFLGWPGEVGLKSENGKEHDLDGLQPDEGAHLFQQSAPQRGSDIELAQAERLSHQVAGHPLSLRLLGGAFNQLAPLSLSAFIADCETHLLEAENKYVGQNHRHRTLYACIETSVRYLEPELAQLFGKLWLFHAPFLASTAVDVFNPTSDEATKSTSPVAQHLYALWQRSLLTREQETLREGNVVFYRVLPTLRPYIEHYLADPSEREALETRFGLVLASLVRYLYEELDKGSIAVFLATLLRDDIERAVSLLSEETRGYYLLRWGWVLQRLGNRQRGLEFTERAYEIGQESDQQLMLAALNNMATVYQRMGQTSRALELFEQGLLLLREEGDHAGEAAMLNNMAAVYQRMGQTSRALEWLEQVLLLMQEIGEQKREAATLNNMAAVYQNIGQLGRALELFEQALSLRRKVGDRVGEAITLSNMALVYQNIGQPDRALELYEQALPLMQEMGDRAEEATALNGLANLFLSLKRHTEALVAFERSIALEQIVHHPAGEVAGLVGLAFLLYQHLQRPQDAIKQLEQALAVMEITGLPRDATGRTAEDIRTSLDAMRQGHSLTSPRNTSQTMPQEQIHIIVSNTITVLTAMPERKAEWYQSITSFLHDAQQRGDTRQIEVDFFKCILALLDGQEPTLPTDHPYAPALKEIQAGILSGALQKKSDEELPFDPELIPRSITAILGTPQDKMQHAQYLNSLMSQTMDEALKALLQTIQVSLFRGNRSSLGENLEGVYRQAWEAIVVGVELEGLNPQLVDALIKNTLAVLGPVPEKQQEWKGTLSQYFKQAQESGADALAQLVDFIQQLIDAQGNASGLGEDLQGIYAKIWNAIVSQLPSPS